MEREAQSTALHPRSPPQAVTKATSAVLWLVARSIDTATHHHHAKLVVRANGLNLGSLFSAVLHSRFREIIYQYPLGGRPIHQVRDEYKLTPVC